MVKKEYTEFLGLPIKMLVVNDGHKPYVYNTSLEPDAVAVTHEDGISFPVFEIKPVYVPGESGRVPWFNVFYAKDKILVTVNRLFVVEVVYDIEYWKST